jgi:hypothetical protein
MKSAEGFFSCFLGLLVFGLLAACGPALPPQPPGASPAAEVVFRWGSPELAEVMPLSEELAPVAVGESGLIRATLPQTDLREGERYLEVLMEKLEGENTSGFSWRVELLPLGTNEVLWQAKQEQVEGKRALLRFDARTPGSGMVRVGLYRGNTLVDLCELLYKVTLDPVLPPGQPVPLFVDDPWAGDVSRSWISFGVPMPRGALWDVEDWELRDESGNPVKAQIRPVATWGEHGSVRWMRVDAFPRKALCGMHLVRQDPKLKKGKPPVAGLFWKKEGDAFLIDTGLSQFRLEPRLALLNQIEMEGETIVQNNEQQRGLYVIDQHGRLGRPLPEETSVNLEWQGPLAACFRVDGVYASEAGEELARFVAWFEFAAETSEVRVTHHFILTRDTREVWFREVGWEFAWDQWKAGEAIPAATRGVRGRMEGEFPLTGEFLYAQTSHRRYGGGSDEFRVGEHSESLPGREGEMGDWFGVTGQGRGFLMGCRESARQHPKAWVAGPGFLRFEMFHPGAGEELDFRPPALLARWNAGGWIPDALVGETLSLPTNAIGWSKTHFLVLQPFRGENPAETLVEAGNSFSIPVLAGAAPDWVYHSRVAGPLYPRDRERFAEAEAFIDEAFTYWENEQEELGEYGFVDFFTGPHHTRAIPQSQGRLRASYTLRNAFWLLYLRSSERRFFEMAAWTNRVYLDSYLAGWDGPRRIRGLYLHSVGTDDPYASLPFYWEGFTRPSLGTHTNLQQFLYDYFLTGNPRARLGVLSYAEGVKRWWQESGTDWRILAVLRAVNQAYSLTWDEDLRVIQEKILNQVYDSGSPVFLTAEGRPYESSTYKTQEDLSSLIEGYELHGTTRYLQMATAVSRYWWNSLAPGPRFERGRSGRFLWGQTRDPWIAQGLWNEVRRETTEPIETNSASAVFRFQGIPYALSAVVESNADRKPVASWAGAEILTGRGILLLPKKQGRSLEARLFFQSDEWLAPVNVAPIGPVSQIGLRLLSLRQAVDEASVLQVPLDTEPVDLRVDLPGDGGQMAFLNDDSPLLLLADGWWRPLPERMNPPARIYFELPEGIAGASITFEKNANLFAPGGLPFPDDQPMRGRVSLPSGRAGIWGFELPEGGAVRVEGFPGIFTREQNQSVPELALDSLDLSAASRPLWPGSGISLPRGSTLVLDDLDLPFQEGTIEFFFKPAWDSFSGSDRVRRRLLSILTEGGNDWSFRYVIDSSRAGWPGHPWSQSHVFEWEIDTEGPARTRAVRVRRAVLEAGEWIHVALVWGQITAGHSAARSASAFDLKIFVNGREGRSVSWPRLGNLAASRPAALVLGPDLEGEIAGLRISSIRRYSDAFHPPAKADLQPDVDTVAWFSFEDSLQGTNAEGTVVGRVIKTDP